MSTIIAPAVGRLREPEVISAATKAAGFSVLQGICLALICLAVLGFHLRLITDPMCVRWEPSQTEIYAWNLAHYGPVFCRFLRVDAVIDGVPVFHATHPSLFHLWGALFYKLFGLTEVSTRLPSLIAVLVGMILLAFLARRFLPPWGAVLAAALYGLSPVVLYFGRVHVFHATVVCFTIALYLSWWRWWEHSTWKRAAVVILVVLAGSQTDWPFYLSLGVLFLWSLTLRSAKAILFTIGLNVVAVGAAAAFFAYVGWATGTLGDISHSATNRSQPRMLLNAAFYSRVFDHLVAYYGSVLLVLLCAALLDACRATRFDRTSRPTAVCLLALFGQPLVYWAMFPNAPYIHPWSTYYLMLPLALLLAWFLSRQPVTLALLLVAVVLWDGQRAFWGQYNYTRDLTSLEIATHLKKYFDEEPDATGITVLNPDTRSWFYTGVQSFRSPAYSDWKKLEQRIRSDPPDWISIPNYRGFEGDNAEVRQKLDRFLPLAGYSLHHNGLRRLWHRPAGAGRGVLPLLLTASRLDAYLYDRRDGELVRRENYELPKDIPYPSIAARGMSRAVMKLHPVADVVHGTQFTGFPIRTGVRLRAYIGLQPETMSQSDGVAFSIYLREGGNTHLVYYRVVRPTVNAFDRDGLIPVVVAFTAFEGKTVDIILCTETAGTPAYDWALWDNPRLVPETVSGEDGADPAAPYPTLACSRASVTGARLVAVPGRGVGPLVLGGPPPRALDGVEVRTTDTATAGSRIAYPGLGLAADTDSSGNVCRIEIGRGYPGGTAFPFDFGWSVDALFAVLGGPKATANSAPAIDEQALDGVLRRVNGTASIGYPDLGLVVILENDRIARCLMYPVRRID